jgi:serine phosphatase RsbU (regulator of sigma subunit)
LKKDDVILLYTDGVSEALNLEFEEYSEERWRKLQKSMNNSANEILNGIKRMCRYSHREIFSPMI